MVRSLIHRSSLALLTVIVWGGGPRPGLPSIVQAASEPTPSDGAEDSYGLMVQAEQQREAGDHAAAARSYAAAYRALSEVEQAGLMGEIALENALADYGLAYEGARQEVPLLEEWVALLEGFVEGRARLHRAGQAEAVPPSLEAELTRLRALLGEVRASSEVAEPDGVDGSESVGSVAAWSRSSPADEGGRGRRRSDVVILASGLTSLVGGAGLIAGGAWNFGEIDRRKQAQRVALEEGEFTYGVREQYLAQLDDWQEGQRGTATGLVVGGSVLAAVGVGLIAWSAVRMRSRNRDRNRNHGRVSRQRVSGGGPMIWRGRVGLVVTVAF